jgi:membrane associated rhomboid family serine protease
LLPIRDVNPTAIRPLLTWGLILANVLVFFWLQPQESPEAERFTYRHAAIACELTKGAPLDLEEIRSGSCVDDTLGNQAFPGKNVWLAVGTSMFLHAGILHLVFNMWVLWIFGNNVEEAFGHLGFILFYAAAGVAATLGFVALNPYLTIPLVGASGAIAGVMGAYLVLFPRHLVMTLILFRIVGIPAVVFLGIWFLSQFLMAGGETNIAWEAHVAGFLFGALIAVPFRERLLSRTLEAQSVGGRSRY